MRVPRGREGDYSKAFDIFLLADKEVKTVEKHGPPWSPAWPRPFTRRVRKHKVYKQGRTGSKVTGDGVSVTLSLMDTTQQRQAAYWNPSGPHKGKVLSKQKGKKRIIIIFPASGRCDSIWSRLRSKNNTRRGDTSLQCPTQDFILQGHGWKCFSVSLALLWSDRKRVSGKTSVQKCHIWLTSDSSRANHSQRLNFGMTFSVSAYMRDSLASLNDV